MMTMTLKKPCNLLLSQDQLYVFGVWPHAHAHSAWVYDFVRVLALQKSQIRPQGQSIGYHFIGQNTLNNYSLTK